MGKRFTILLISFLGISTILVYLAIGAFLFQKDLIFPKVQASPATCTVNDDFVINGTVGIGTIPVIDLAIGDSDTGLSQEGDGQLAVRANWGEIARFSSNGRVGIGTSSPANIFHIQTDQNWPRIILESTGFPANPTAELNLLTEDAAGITQEMNIYHTAGSGMGIWTSYAGFVFVILPNGNVGIGTDDPGTNKLKVAGDTEITGNLNVGGDYMKNGVNLVSHGTFTNRCGGIGSLVPSGFTADDCIVSCTEVIGYGDPSCTIGPEFHPPDPGDFQIRCNGVFDGTSATYKATGRYICVNQ